MRILVYGINYAPELTGVGKYTSEVVEWLAARGHDVRVVTAPPYYPAWKIQEGYSAVRYSIERFGGAKIFRCPLWVPTKVNGFGRLLHLLSFALSSLPVVLSQVAWRPQVVFLVEPTFFCAPATLAIATLSGSAAWLHVQDFEVDAAFDLGLLPASGFIHRFALALESFLIRRFDRASTISSNMVQRLLAKGVKQHQALLLPNWVDTEAIKPLQHSNSFRDELNITDEDVLLLYSGNMGTKQGLDILPELARHFESDAHVKFLFCGDGAFRPQLEQLVNGLKNVILLPLQPVERLNELLNAADIHLLPQRADAADLVMPSKLTGMLASGRPVVTTAAPGTQVARVVEGCGIAVSAGTPESLYAAIHSLVDNPSLRHSLGEAARNYAVEHLGREHVLQELVAELEAVGAQVQRDYRP